MLYCIVVTNARFEEQLMNIKNLSIYLCISAWMLGSVRTLEAYRVVAVDEPTYHKPGHTEAVHLTDEEKASLDYALRNFLTTEQEGNQRIDDSLITKVQAACEFDGACELIGRVMGDFKGKKLRDLFSAIGLRTDL
jgi:hypothetical protein